MGLGGGWLMSLAIGRRIEAVSLAARQVMEGDLDDVVDALITDHQARLLAEAEA